MNEIIKSLYDRKSVRQFEDKKVPSDIKQELLNATLQAPSAGNQILYSIIDVTDEKLKEELSKSCDNQPFIKTAPLVFIFVADHTRWHKSFTLAKAEPKDTGVGDLFIAITDAAIAAQNMVVAAESLGLGSCYIGDIMENCELHREMLNLPLESVPVCMLVLGYPTQSQIDRKKPDRFNTKYIVGENTYPHLSDEELKECYYDRANKSKVEGREVQSFDDFMQAFCKRKFNSDFSKEMKRSIEVYLKAFMK